MAQELDQQTLQISVKSGEITFKAIRNIIQTMLYNRKAIEHGEQGIRKLNLQGKKLESVPITDADLKTLRRELNRYAVDFSIKKDRKTGEHSVFFKGQDVERVHMALQKCVQSAAVGRDDTKHFQSMKEIMKNATERAAQRAAERPAPQRPARGQEI